MTSKNRDNLANSVFYNKNHAIILKDIKKNNDNNK